jgi:hypothetical protein
MVDRALLSRVAEATIKDFVDRIAERLDAQMALVLRPAAS